MEADERPTKIRKLSSGSLELVDVTEDHAGRLSSTSKLEQFSQNRSTDFQQGENLAPTAHKDSDSLSPNLGDLPPVVPGQVPPQNLSKNQLKKIRKKQEWEAGRADRKAIKKAKDKDRKKRKREEREQENERRKANGEDELPPPEKPPARKGVCLPITFVIDCGFDDKMSDGERISLGSQVTRSYSDNHKAPYQAHLVVSSWGGLLRERFETVLRSNHKSWKGIEFTESDFVAAAEQATEVMRGPEGGKLDGVFKQYSDSTSRTRNHKNGNSSRLSPTIDSSSNDPPNQEPQPQPQTEPSSSSPSSGPLPLPTPETIYLTSDSPNILTTLSPYSTYIIGGIVDKNRHKGICHRLARDRGVKTAKLPIAEFMEMQSRAVLATNHVVEIMVRWLECGDWGESFMRVIPARKGGRLKGSGAGAGREKGDKDALGKPAGDRVDGDGSGEGDDDEDAVSVLSDENGNENGNENGHEDGNIGEDEDEDGDSEVNIIDASVNPVNSKGGASKYTAEASTPAT